MNSNSNNERKFVHSVVEELWAAKESLPFKPTPDVDLVWVVSSVGTVKEPADLGPDSPYTGALFDRGVVDEGVRVVREVTALRAGKPVEDVTPDDIEASGPTLLYNGESPGLPHSKFPNQNRHFRELTEEEGFPIPRSKIIVGDIDEANTPAQVRQIAEYLEGRDVAVRKVAVVCGLPHITRVGRYVERHKALLPEGISLVVDPVPQEEGNKETEIATLEVKKARQYLKKGDLAVRSVFFPESVPDRRPHLPKDKRLIRG